MTTSSAAAILSRYDLSDAETRQVCHDELLEAGHEDAALGLAEDDYSFLDAEGLAGLLSSFGRHDDPSSVPGLVTRINEGPTDWVCDCEDGGDTTLEGMDLDEAREAAEGWLADGDWEPMTKVTGRIYPAGTDGRWCAHDRDYDVSITTDEPDEPDCPEAAEHDWTSEYEGGCRENPGVWSTGGTSMLFVSHCRHCGMERREVSRGMRRNPGERDSITYSEPGADWVAEHVGE